MARSSRRCGPHRRKRRSAASPRSERRLLRRAASPKASSNTVRASSANLVLSLAKCAGAATLIQHSASWTLVKSIPKPSSEARDADRAAAATLPQAPRRQAPGPGPWWWRGSMRRPGPVSRPSMAPGPGRCRGRPRFGVRASGSTPAPSSMAGSSWTPRARGSTVAAGNRPAASGPGRPERVPGLPAALPVEAVRASGRVPGQVPRASGARWSVGPRVSLYPWETLSLLPEQ